MMRRRRDHGRGRSARGGRAGQGAISSRALTLQSTEGIDLRSWAASVKALHLSLLPKISAAIALATRYPIALSRSTLSPCLPPLTSSPFFLSEPALLIIDVNNKYLRG
jgi:hypothetical protein